MTDISINEQHFQTKIDDYAPVVGKNTIDELKMLGRHLSGKVIQNINSTYSGGGVAEILNRMMPLLNQLGVDARWDVIQGNNDFFDITKKFHNALQGQSEQVSDDELALFIEVSHQNMDRLKLVGDILFIHDPQPIIFIEKKPEYGRQWVWRCHIDVSRPDSRIWEFIKQFVVRYDAAIFSAPNFAQQLPIRQFMISPSIDPLSEKNRELSRGQIDAVLNKYGLDAEKPLVVQISRFDRLKDPIGVIDAFEMAQKSSDCQLVLAGGTATDDPECASVLSEVRERAGSNPDIKILLIPPESDLEINALQRAATVIFQKSLREGFGLTISEALWKGKPVVASAVGGIPLQIKNKLTGLLCYSVEGAAYALRQLLANPDYARKLGDNGREHVRQHFLITRHVRDYLLLFISLGKKEEVIYL